jgi:uncharacterized protein (TIGR03663 family)
MTRANCCVLILIATVAAGAFRLPHLALRPMHCDEAVQAYKFGELLDQHRYEYDRREYHGPTLEYLTLVPAWLNRVRAFPELNEVDLRIVPVILGILLLLGLLLLADGLGWGPAVFAAFLTAVSPAMVFYSRYYIHEMLLVCFTFGLLVCGYRYLQSRKRTWAVAAGVCAGLMHATKETCIIAFASMAVAGAVLFLLRKKAGHSLSRDLQGIRIRPLALAAAVAMIVSILFFSSFFNHPQGILDSIRTYQNYLNRAGHNPVHTHPWYFYLGLLSFYQYADGPIYSEALILVLALVGLGVAVTGKGVADTNRGLLRFLGVYTLVMTAVYSLIPYKTPWCLLGFLQAMILLAGVGASFLLQLRPRFLGLGLGGLLALGGAHLAAQSYSGNFKYYADSRNPYVYAHTSTDIFRIVDRVKEMAAVHEDGIRMRVQVICPNADYWPLPWYLRGYRVEYSSDVPEQRPPAPVILAQPAVEPALMRFLYELPPPGKRELYMHLFHQDGRLLFLQLRPTVEIRGFVAKSLWDRYLERDSNAANVPTPEPNPPRARTNDPRAARLPSRQD